MLGSYSFNLLRLPKAIQLYTLRREVRRMIEKKAPAFTELSEFASVGAGGKVVFASDDFFATCENMLADSDPLWLADKYTEYGKWMDGWETRRKRVAGHDWCILKLGTKCVIRGLLIDTAYFTGNYAPKFSIQAACLTPEEESILPDRNACLGTACRATELEAIEKIETNKWDDIVPVTALRPGYDETRLNYQKVLSDEAYTHVRVNIFPDGGIARLRVYGEARPERPLPHHLVDLLSLLNGTTCQGYSNAHYGHPRNMIKPCKSKCMSDGWETARRLDRPEVIEANEDGTLKVPGEEWAVFKLGFPGRIKELCVDTAHFKGNFPDSVKIEGTFSSRDWTPESRPQWHSILRASKLSAHRDHWYNCESDLVTHVRVTMAPDGGISRVRAFGFVDNSLMV